MKTKNHVNNVDKEQRFYYHHHQVLKTDLLVN